MQPRPPILWNPDARLIVLEMDNVLSASSSGDVYSPRRMYYPRSVQRTLELAKSTPHLHIVVTSNTASTNEIKTALHAIFVSEHPNIHILGKETAQEYAEGKFGVVETICKEVGIQAQAVTWVDTGFDAIVSAFKKGYTPILLPCYSSSATRGVRIVQSSDYLDCLPAIIAMLDRNPFLQKIREIKINNQNYNTPIIAYQLAAVYRQALARYQLSRPHATQLKADQPTYREVQYPSANVKNVANQLPYIDGKLVGSPKGFLDSLYHRVFTIVKQFAASEKVRTSKTGFFSSLFTTDTSSDVTEMLTALQQKLASTARQIQPDKLDSYELLGKDLLNFILIQKKRFLSYPTTDNSRQLLMVLNSLVEEFSKHFVAPQTDVDHDTHPISTFGYRS